MTIFVNEKQKSVRRPEGEKVIVLTRERTETFRVSPDQKREILESIAQAKRGEFVEGDDLLRELDEAN